MQAAPLEQRTARDSDVRGVIRGRIFTHREMPTRDNSVSSCIRMRCKT